MSMAAGAPAPPDPLAGPAFIVARSLLLCGAITLDEPIKELARKVQDHARMRFAADIAGESQKDLEFWIRDLLRVEPGMEDRHPVDRLYERLSAALALDVSWSATGPIVPAKAVRTWLGALNDFDESFLLCFDLLRGRRTFDSPPPIPARWRVVTHVGDVQLDALLEGKATDLHVHLSGTRQAGVTWARIMASERGWADFSALGTQFESELGACWADVATRAYEDRRLLCRRLSLPSPVLRTIWREPAPSRILRDEREFLVRALAHVRRERAGPSALTGEAVDEEEALWRYVAAKHQFQRCTRQPAFAATPGLTHFDGRFFRATKHNERGRHAARPIGGPPSFRSGKGFARVEHEAAARVLAEEGCLAEVELRISPFDRVADYLAFLSNWQRILSGLREDPAFGQLPDVRFAVHLVRTHGAHEKRLERVRRRHGGRLATAALWRGFHGEIGRQTAVLHRALCDPRHPDLTRLISRIDVAGQERDTPIELFAPYLRLLRGDERALQLLEEIVAGRWRDGRGHCGASGDRRPNAHDYFVHAAEWRRMVATRRHRDRTGGPLILTLHAGEDFADPLEGLFQIWAAVETSGMKAGEGIGHALALGASLDRWCSPFSRLSRLQNWASLLWLRFVLRHIDPAQLWTAEGNVLGELIAKADHALFGARRGERMDRDFERFYMPGNAIPAIPETIWARGMLDETGVSALDRAPLRPLVARAQQWLRRHLIDKEIIIEANPSSNIRVSGATRLADLPTVALFEHVRDGLLFCINTDNPGTFASSIRTEYAVLLQGARERAAQRRAAGEPALSELEIRGLLQHVREIGRTLVKRR